MTPSAIIDLWHAHCEQYGPDVDLFERRYPFSWADRDAEWAMVCEALDAHDSVGRSSEPEPEEDEPEFEWEEYGEPVGAMER